MLYSDIQELKTILDIDPADTTDDKKLGFFNEWAGDIIDEALNQRPISLKSRTEYPKPTGTQKLCLKARPVYVTPNPQVWVDSTAYWGSASGAFATSTALTFGTDFALQLDGETDDDGATSRSGILVRINNIWERPSVRQRGYLTPFIWDGVGSIKVTYTGGYTVDNLPASFRAAGNLLVSRLRYIFPLGMELGSDGWEERSVSYLQERKGYLLSLVKPLLSPFRNWKFQ